MKRLLIWIACAVIAVFAVVACGGGGSATDKMTIVGTGS